MVGRRQIDTQARVARLLDEGLAQAEIARRLGISKSTVCYHVRTLGHEADERCNRRYDWDAIQRFYDEGHSITACQLRFGFSRRTWNDARLRGAVRSRPQATPPDAFFVAGRLRNGLHVKLRLLAAGLREDRCDICGVTDWRGERLAIELHHVNGDRRDNRLENLQLLCPNCHSQTDSWGGRNARRTTPGGTA